VVTYGVYPESLFLSVRNTQHSVTWYVHHHGDNPDLELRLKQFAASADVYLRLHRQNRGLARSWNDGVEQSIADGNDFTILLNDDLFFYENAFDQFVDFLTEHPDFGIAIAHGFEPPTGTVTQQGFACCALGEPVLEAIGAFDENLGPAYYEDTDYWHRARLAGVAVIFDTRPLVQHDRSRTIRAASGEARRSLERAIGANRAYFIRKWGGLEGDIRFQRPFDDAGFDRKIERARRSAPYGYPYDRLDGQFSENMAHVQNLGDTWSRPNQWCGEPGSGAWIEGLLLAAIAGVAPSDLEYAGVFEGNRSADWFKCGEYLGSRGASAPLRGLRLRLTGVSAHTHRLWCESTFVGGSAIGPISGTELCCVADRHRPLEAFRFGAAPVADRGAKSSPFANG